MTGVAWTDSVDGLTIAEGLDLGPLWAVLDRPGWVVTPDRTMRGAPMLRLTEGPAGRGRPRASYVLVAGDGSTLGALLAAFGKLVDRHAEGQVDDDGADS